MDIRIEGYDEYVKDHNSVVTNRTPFTETELQELAKDRIEIREGESDEFSFAILDQKNKDVVEFNFDVVREEENLQTCILRYREMC